ncbi:hypothetical protein MiSe_39400 [Microseira wollei NIES-4236]|uniref:DUF4350 domain-containing protein n=1 Tax=Microseira wollei NIES-4236 TaxID=2530354 RepID=A0AAV3XET0_9CYAN|nr:hypothetical protein MiSe_39400 [Microseira wollei NIES-4236]
MAIAITAIILLTLFAAPTTGNRTTSGSTYSRAPDGYGAWYAFMEKRGTPVKRWQKPFDQFPNSRYPMTLLRVNSGLGRGWPYKQELDWIEKGNTLVVLGVGSPVTEASFSTLQESAAGRVKIETRRRQKLGKEEEQRLSDRFGAIVWQQKLGKGQVIFATTPHLAANAYQDEAGNFEFLASLVTVAAGEQVSRGAEEQRSRGAEEQVSRGAEEQLAISNYQLAISNYQSAISNYQLPIQNPVWVDEYIHGYKDKEVIAKEDGKDWVTYLANTPLFPAMVQAGVILLVLVLAKNRRLGPPISVAAPRVDNSEAYIKALAGVLQKAESREFVIEVIGKQEQLQLQQALGLGSVLLSPQTLVAAWVQQTGRPASELEQVLQRQSKKRRIGERDLLTWLEQWQKIRLIGNR